jgi:hypothetical protein
MEIDPLSLMGTSIALIALIGKHFYYDAAKNTAICERVSRLETQCNELTGITEDVREIKTKVNLFWQALETQIPSMLMKGNPIDQDSKLFELLSKFVSRQISNGELMELTEQLDLAARDESHPAGERLALISLSAVVKSKMAAMTANGGAIWTYS